MIPIIIAAPNRAFLIAIVVTVGSVSGGAVGYFIGSQLFSSIGLPILEFYHKIESFELFRKQFNAQGHWAVLIDIKFKHLKILYIRIKNLQPPR
jgi:membrane protein YqaA with SNARE-associated domain